MDDQYWQKKWQLGDTLFHQGHPHDELVKYFSRLSGNRVMVPLCGKSTDLLWLRSKGYEVVGIELSPIACEALFVENGLQFTKRPLGPGILFETEKLKVWCGDYFLAPTSLWEGCTAVYDRAALIALPDSVRIKYVQHLNEVWAGKAPAGSSLLLITLEYRTDKIIGPPFSVSEEEVHTLYKNYFDIERLSSTSDHPLSGREKFNEIKVSEKTFNLTVTK